MNWLSNYRAKMDCFIKKKVTLRGLDEKGVTFREGNVMLNCVILAMTASKLMRKGCMVYLAYVIDFRKGERD